ncbi:hypothetical protein LTR60_003868, partial [Cryomyces antarcticus]
RNRAFSGRANPNETFDRLTSDSTGRNRSGSGFDEDYSYSDSKPKPSRPTGPKPSFVSRKSSLAANQAIAKFTFEADQPGDLGFKKGDVITIVKRTDNATDWWTGRVDGREGIFPSNYVETV